MTFVKLYGLNFVANIMLKLDSSKNYAFFLNKICQMSKKSTIFAQVNLLIF